MTSIPPGWHAVTPRIVVQDVAGFVEFLRRVFGARGEIRGDAPSLIWIGDSLLMISGAGQREAFPAFLYVYVEDADSTWRLAVEAGAASLEEVRETPYGDRRGMLRDPWGNVWQVATPIARPR
ncbi:MAG TPA: VOC family protein [Thermoanaerobaculia bacterium]|nr:VOC family protein [Thermoanaerobaculia bacterium]